ncbi:MAG: sterol desaturase family protein [Gammaproteobacteria bacterium]|nr:sterol desaturase family protein [Gammaproteobacteria bacterium]
MIEFITSNENIIRPSVFVGMLVIMGLWEVIAPRRALTVSKLLRWSNNLGLVFFNSFISKLVFPLAATGVAAFAAEHGWGLLNLYSLPTVAAIVLAIIALDFIIYLQHVLVHAVPALWRLHRVHHADLDYDVTTGSRFHTIEIILSMLIKFAAIVVLGAPVVAVIIFEVLLNGMAMFNHANVKLPLSLDKVLRWLIVTPDMHRVHHSIEDDETNSNFGFNLSCWDRLFGTYRQQPRKGHEAMMLGIRTFREPKQASWITGMLLMPFVGTVSDYAINRRQWTANEEQQNHEQ